VTSMLERTGSSAAPAPRRSRADVVATLPVAGVTAGLWAAAVGLLAIGVVAAVVWAVSSRGDDSITTPLRASGVLWLVAHHAPVSVGPLTITLLPLALVAIPLLLLARAGRWAARITSTTTVPDAVLLVVTGTVTYAAVAFLLTQVSSLADATVSVAAGVLSAATVAALGLGWGVARAAGLLDRLAARLPIVVRRAGAAAATSAMVLVVASGLVALLSLVAHWSAVTALTRASATSLSAAAGVLVLSMAYLPNLLVWALAYLAGPGFLVGAGTGVDPFSSSGALLPAVPVLGAIPSDPAPLAPLLLLLPVLAGALGSVALRRRGGIALVDEAVALLLAAGLVGLAAGVACWLSGGAIGAERLAQVGPHGLAVGLAVAALTAAGSLLWSLLAHALPGLWVRD